MTWLRQSWLIAILLLVTIGPAAAQSRRVLLLHSYGPYFAPWNFLSGRFREELIKQSPSPVDLYEASLESARFVQPIDPEPLLDYLHTLFAGRTLDLIVAVGSPAARFVQVHRSQFFPSTPLLIAGADQRAFSDAGLTANDTVVPVTIDIPKFIENIFQVLPNTTHIAWAVGASPLERFWAQELGRASQPFTNRVTFEYFTQLSFEDMLKRAAELPPGSAISYMDLRVDALGIPLDQSRVLSRLHETASAPIFGYIDSDLGQGIVGGPLISIQEVARQTAVVAVRILGGESAGGIKTPALGFGAPVYDWRELQRWNISKARLPPGSIVRFREPTVWERYRWLLIGAFTAVSLQAGMIIWLLFERRSRRKAEVEARRRSLEVVHLSRTAEAGALSVSFAHELSQPLTAIMLGAEAADGLLGSETTPTAVSVKKILSDIRQADEHAAGIISHVKTLLKRRSEVEPQEFDLNGAIADAMQILMPEAKKRSVRLRAIGVPQALPVQADPIHLQQVILNLARNGMDAMSTIAPDARRMTIEMALPCESTIEVSVRDSGTGIPKHKLREIFNTFYTTKEQGTGLGLSIVRTIVETYGGKIWAENCPGGGAVFRFTLPLIRQSDSQDRRASGQVSDMPSIRN
jgi:signal transduction histidine kinase